MNKNRIVTNNPINKRINNLIKNELMFSSSSTNSINNCKSATSSVDLPDETQSSTSGSTLSFEQYNRLNSALNKKSTNKKLQQLKGIDQLTDTSCKSTVTNTLSDLDSIRIKSNNNINNNLSEFKLQRKKFIKCILREDVHILKSAYENNKIDLLSMKDKHRNTLMHIACGFGRLKSVQTLMKVCPKLIDQVDDKGHTPIDVAIKHGQLEVIKWLLAKTNRLIVDSQINSIYDTGSTSNKKSCLHFAAKHGENEILRYILNEMHRLQLSMDIQDCNGNTACHLAAKYGHLDCLQTLVEFNCDITIVNKNGHTPCFMAEYHGNNECVHYLMIVETCINLSIKVVRLSRKLRETKSNNEVLKAQMDEAIAINNDFINQRENVMNISLDLMQRQINELESKIMFEIEKFNSENRNLKEKLDILNSQLKSFTNSNDKLIEGGTSCNSINNKNLLIQPNIESVRQDFQNTKQICSKVIQMDQKKLDSIKNRFDEIKTSLNSSIASSTQDILKSKCNNQMSSCDNTDIIENREHFEILRKMYQETTHKLMIFRNALKETTKPNDSLSQRPKTATGPRRDSPPNVTNSNNNDKNNNNNNSNKSSSSSSSLNSAKNMIDSRNIKSSTPTLIRTNPNYFSSRRSSNPNINPNNNNNDNYIEYSSNDETLSENDLDDRLNQENENIIEDDDEIIINFSSSHNRKSPKGNQKIYMKPEIYLTTSDNENEVDEEQSSEQPSIQTIIENQNLITNGNNMISTISSKNNATYIKETYSPPPPPQLPPPHYIIEEIEEKIEEQFEEHEELEENHHHHQVLNSYQY